MRTELSWTHYRIISRIENPDHTIRYIEHAIEGTGIPVSETPPNNKIKKETISKR